MPRFHFCLIRECCFVLTVLLCKRNYLLENSDIKELASNKIKTGGTAGSHTSGSVYLSPDVPYLASDSIRIICISNHVPAILTE